MIYSSEASENEHNNVTSLGYINHSGCRIIFGVFAGISSNEI